MGLESKDIKEQKNNPPRVIGHEFAGEIVDVGKEVKGYEKEMMKLCLRS